jgi:hypothetical protein
MRKRLVLLTTLLASSLCYAQDMGDDQVPKNKKGNEILPKEGDIGLGFNTIPILDMFLETFKSTSSGSGNIVNYAQSNNQIVGKYFLDAKTAIRARFGINTISGTMVNYVQDAPAMHQANLGTADDIAAASLLTVEDQMSFSKNNLLFSIGLEKRRGYRRLQGFYGAEFGIGNTASREKTSYGNAISDQYQTYYTGNFNSMSVISIDPNTYGRQARVLETHHRGGIRLGLRGFIGVEYFIFTKISIAAEYGWGYSFVTRRAATLKREVFSNGQAGPTVITEQVETDSREVLKGFSVDNNNGSVFSMNNTLNGNTSLNGGAGSLTLIFHF